MTRTAASKLARLASRQIPIQRSSTSTLFRSTPRLIRPALSTHSVLRAFSAQPSIRKGLSPESAEPAPPSVTSDAATNLSPTELTQSEYNEISDQYMDDLVAKLEELQEQREDVDVEYSAGVLTLVFPPLGTYVINKQPPNKQIWLSSPISGPKRYDWVVLSEGQDSKEGTGQGEWIYLRDGTSLDDIFLKELGVAVAVE
ncbi:hypothetical protein BP6252_03550 [Coleophoma cylindrospora]|uniref:ferroxidase n=1 Tax=Coleophoma cylindrospora TaxID=1849047 RepID=A0A3D8S9G2_9HELO|nr:hypothetical protein BP6252_03550 [Coleophoma cylindrospora]